MNVSPERTGPYVFPMQGDYREKIAPGWITWDDALEMYRYYYALYGGDHSLSRMGERGGFCPGEYEVMKREYERWVAEGRYRARRLPTLDEIRRIAGEHYAPRGVPVVPVVT